MAASCCILNQLWSKTHMLTSEWQPKLVLLELTAPDCLHLIPICDDAMGNRVGKAEDATLGLCLIANIELLLTHAKPVGASSKAPTDQDTR